MEAGGRITGELERDCYIYGVQKEDVSRSACGEEEAYQLRLMVEMLNNQLFIARVETRRQKVEVSRLNTQLELAQELIEFQRKEMKELRLKLKEAKKKGCETEKDNGEQENGDFDLEEVDWAKECEKRGIPIPSPSTLAEAKRDAADQDLGGGSPEGEDNLTSGPDSTLSSSGPPQLDLFGNVGLETTDNGMDTGSSPAQPPKRVKVLRKSGQKLVSEFGQKRKKCHYCYKTFSSSMNMRLHVAAMHSSILDNAKKRGRPSSGNFKCNDCGNYFSSKVSRSQHFKRVHLRLETKTCTICGKTLSNAYALRRHMLTFHASVGNNDTITSAN